jgi:hypothetical protein
MKQTSENSEFTAPGKKGGNCEFVTTKSDKVMSGNLCTQYCTAKRTVPQADSKQRRQADVYGTVDVLVETYDCSDAPSSWLCMLEAQAITIEIMRALSFHFKSARTIEIMRAFISFQISSNLVAKPAATPRRTSLAPSRVHKYTDSSDSSRGTHPEGCFPCTPTPSRDNPSPRLRGLCRAFGLWELP